MGLCWSCRYTSRQHRSNVIRLAVAAAKAVLLVDEVHACQWMV